MSELDVPEVEDVTTDVDTDIDTPEVKTVNEDEAKLFAKYWVDPDNATTDDLLRIIKRNEKAESKIVSEKKAKPEVRNDEEAPMTKFDFELEKFIDKNPDVAEYRDEIATIAKEKKLTLGQAKILVEADDKTIANRKKTTLSRISDWDTPEPNTYSKDYLAKLDPKNPKDREAYNRIMDKVEAWKATVK